MSTSEKSSMMGAGWHTGPAQKEESMGEAQNGSPLVGVWRLVSLGFREENGETRRPLGDNVRGVLIYTAGGLVSAQLIPPGRPRFVSGDQERATPDEIKAAFDGCTSYYGRYELDPAGGRVVHAIEASLYPNYEGQGQVRYFRLDGDRLEITTAPILWQERPRVVVLVWERMEG
jgi:hypothetical protein